MAVLTLASIVEGHGEVESLPKLIARIGGELAPSAALNICRPIRVPKTRLLKDGELERAVALARKKSPPPAALLILLDSDDDAPCRAGPALLDRARRAQGDILTKVVLAKREFECWFLAAAASLAGQRGLPSELVPPTNPEDIRGAKEWLRNHMPPSRTYAPTVDQPALTAIFDMAAARRAAPSFDKFYRDLTDIFGHLQRMDSEGA